MSETKYDIIDAAEDSTKLGYSVGVFACKLLRASTLLRKNKINLRGQ